MNVVSWRLTSGANVWDFCDERFSDSHPKTPRTAMGV